MTTVIPSATFSDLTTTYVLEPQTTPFVPTETAIFSDLCRSRSIRCETITSQLARGEPCTLADHVDSTTYTDLNDDCYPNNYWLVGFGGTDRTFAYSGTACPADLTPACTSTLTLLNTGRKPPYVATVTQIWCCPTAPVGSGPGDPGWTCTDKDYDFEKPVSRLCVSLVTEPTVAWFTAFKSAATGTKLEAAYATSLIGPEMSLRVYRPVFPLQIGGAFEPLVSDSGTSQPTATRTGDSNRSTDTGTLSGGPGSSVTGTGPEGSARQRLSTSMIAGIVAGCVVFAILMVLMGMWILLRRRRNAQNGEGKESQGMCLGDAGREKEVRDAAGGTTASSKPAELPSPYNLALAEMGGDERVAELGSYGNSKEED
ncbi:hypothetical protein V8F20_002879 [Naviculisporaceae sp. PSN 640]